MQLYRAALKVAVCIGALTGSYVFAAVPAYAAGTFVIHHGSGGVNTYKNVTIKIIHGALFVTSPDGKGTVVIHRAACSFQGKLMVCFPTSVALVQSGTTSPIDLKIGTVYLNDTDQPQPLTLSSSKVPAHSILLSFTTQRGSYVSINGRIDQVVR